VAAWEVGAVVAEAAAGDDWDDGGAPGLEGPADPDDPASWEILPRDPAAVDDGGRRMNLQLAQAAD